MPGIRTRRMIDANICTSEKLNKISWQARLIFTWMIPRLCDDEGRMDGSPATIKASVVPLAEDLTVAAVEACLKEMAEVPGQGKNDRGLIVWYEIDGRRYIQVKKWDEFQTFHGVKKTESTIPPPPQDPRSGARSTRPGANKNKGMNQATITTGSPDKLAELKKGLKNIGRKMEA